MTKLVKLYGDGASPGPAEYVRALARLERSGRLVPDCYAVGGTVQRLEKSMARLLGKEAALYFPTGTLANLLGVRALCGARPRVIVQADSHLFNDSGDGASVLGGMAMIPIGAGRPHFTGAELKDALGRAASAKVSSPVGAVSVELPMRRLSNRAATLEALREISQTCRGAGVGLHLDGARLFIAAAASGVDPRRYTALCDTVYVSLYKYLGAPSGAILAGPRRLLKDLHHARRMFGGSPAEAFLEAALALDGVEGGAQRRLSNAMRRSRSLIERLGGLIEAYPDGTNVALMPVEKSRSTRVSATFKRSGVLLGAYDAKRGGYAVTFNETLLNRSESALLGIIRRTLAR